MKSVSIGITALVLCGCATNLAPDRKHRDSVPAVEVLEHLYDAGLEVYAIRRAPTSADDGEIFIAPTNMCVPDPVVDSVAAKTTRLSRAEHAERAAALKAEAFRLLRGKVFSDASHTTSPRLIVGTDACALWTPVETY